MLVHCPTCSSTCVRRSRRGALWRAAPAAATALTRATTNAAVVIMLVAFCTGMICWVTATTERVGPGELLRMSEEGVIISFIVLPIAVGVWLTIGFSHLRRTVAWIMFGTVTAICACAALGIDHLQRAVMMNANAWPAFDPVWAKPMLWTCLRATTLAYMFMLLALVGVAPGVGLRRLGGWGRRMLRRWQRRRMIAERRA
jgi:hypothetical protein